MRTKDIIIKTPISSQQDTGPSHLERDGGKRKIGRKRAEEGKRRFQICR
jgi:hypothetical protein